MPVEEDVTKGAAGRKKMYEKGAHKDATTLIHSAQNMKETEKLQTATRINTQRCVNNLWDLQPQRDQHLHD